MCLYKQYRICYNVINKIKQGVIDQDERGYTPLGN